MLSTSEFSSAFGILLKILSRLIFIRDSTEDTVEQ